MSSAIAGILTGVAAKVGAKAVERYLGAGAGELAGTIIDAVAQAAGVKPAEIPQTPTPILEDAVRRVESATPEIIAAYVEQQREANRLMMAEMDKGGPWTWAWRPLTMWVIVALWIWSLVLVPLANAIAAASIPLFMAELTFLTMTYIGLYMGGHTIKDVADKWRQTRQHGGLY